MRKLYLYTIAIFFVGLIATILGIGTSGTLFKTLYDKTVGFFYYLESRGIPVEVIVFLLMILESAGIRVPSEVVMPLGGFLAALGLANFRLVVLAGALGNVVGSVIAYYIGLRGLKILDERFGYIMRYIRDKGSIATFLTRLMPGIRTYAPFALGASRVNMKEFIVYTFIGSFIRCIPRTYVGYVFGAHREEIIESLHRYTPLILAILLDLFIIGIFYEKSSSGRQGVSRSDGYSDEDSGSGHRESEGKPIKQPSDEAEYSEDIGDNGIDDTGNDYKHGG